MHLPSAFSKDVSSCIEGGKLMMEEFISQLRFICTAASLNNLFSLLGRLRKGGGFLDNFHCNLT